MKENRIEPGLLQVFRWYAALRILLVVISPLRILMDSRGSAFIQPEYFQIVYADMLPVLAEMLVLLGYLNWRWLRHKLGVAYLPVALLIALAGPIYEQQTFSIITNIWQPGPFLAIPILLAAWQYNFRTVAFFILGSVLVEIGFSVFFPQEIFFISGGGGRATQSIITYGRLISRTSSSIIVGFIVTRLMRAQREQRQELANANQKLVQHAATLEQLTVSHERNRLSRELHDTLAQTLSALTVQFEAVATVWNDIPKKAQSMLDQMLTTTRDGLNDTRSALQSLRAAPLEELGLSLAIRAMAEEVGKRNDLKLTLNISDTIDMLSLEAEQCYYHVAQEAFENAVQHAGATQLSVSLLQESGKVTLIVADDGSGFDQEDMPDIQRFGITGMRERAELVGAAFAVDSKLGEGTTVLLSFEALA